MKWGKPEWVCFFGVLLGFLLLGAVGLLLFQFLPGNKEQSKEENQVSPVHLESLSPPNDDLDQRIPLKGRPERIISLSPSITEILFAVGAQDRIIAVTPFCEFPPEARDLPKIGGENGWNIEFIRKLRPDLLLAGPIVPADTVRALESIGITTFVFRHAGMQGILQDIRTIGQIVYCSSEAAQLLEQIRLRGKILQERVQEKISTLGRPRILLLYGMDGYFSAGKTTFAGEILEYAGGRNIAASIPGDWPQLSLEFIIREDPQILILAEGFGKGARQSAENILTQIRQDPKWRLLSAVHANRIYLLEEQLLSIPGPRMIEAAEKVALMLYPEIQVP